MRSLILYFVFITLILSCSSDEDTINIEINAEDFEITINEGVENQEILGTLGASTNQGSVTFGLLEQNPENAFSIDENTGELRVENSGLFNYEVYPTITGVAEVSNGGESETLNIQINLLDVEENNLLIRSVNSNLNTGEYFVPDQDNELNFESGEIVSWIHSYGSVTHTKAFASNNDLIVEYNDYITDIAAYCQIESSITYDNLDRITQIVVMGEGDCQYTEDYIIQYDGNQVDFIDQNGNDHKTALFNDNGQIIQFTSGANTVQFQYDGENLIGKTFNGRTETFQYDGYRNPFKTEETLNLSQVDTYIDVVLGRTDGNNYLNNSNNVIRYVISSSQGIDEFDFEYTYNTDDYPINKGIVGNENQIAEYDYYD
ncbi:cadherin repeat domain-containing protein [Flavobacteriaceae bacterium TK19130]|nr:cadherin repeat domain-containing protein [Thermobacterium salinum]